MKTSMVMLLCLVVLACASAPLPESPPIAEHPELASVPTADYMLSWTPVRVQVIHLDVHIDLLSWSVFDVLLRSARDADVVVVQIDSPGGDLDASEKIFRAIKESHRKVVCVVDHLGASGAFLVLQGCDVRVMTKAAMLMVHDSYYTEPAPGDPDGKALEALNRILADVWCARLKVGVGRCYSQYRGHDWWMSADDALEVGAVDQVVPDVRSYISSLRFPLDGS